MQGALLMGVYILVTMSVQAAGFGISYAVQSQFPTAGLMTFLMFFLSSFAIAWPIAWRLTEWGIVKAGYKIASADPNALYGNPDKAANGRAPGLRVAEPVSS